MALRAIGDDPDRPLDLPSSSSSGAAGSLPGMTSAGGAQELDAMARRVIEGNRYMVLGTVEPDGAPRLSPVYYTPARHTDFYWVSSPEAQHSRNVGERPEVQIVIFDSTAPVGHGQAVYLSAVARAVPADDLERACGEAFRPSFGGRAFAPAELREPADLRLYAAAATSCEVHVPGRHPLNHVGIDVRMPADPTRRG